MRSLKVLILEDNPFQLMALHQMLNANRVFDVLTADSVKAAMQALGNRGAVDIAICDLQMDGPDGLEFIGYLAQTRQADALIVLSSAPASVLEGVGHLAQSQGLHVLGCLPKPLSALALGELLATWGWHLRQPQPQPCNVTGQDTRPVLSAAQLLAPQGAGVTDIPALAQQWIVHYQPKVTPAGEVAGVEALVRWQHPELGLLMPGQFMAAVAAEGWLEPLTWRVLDQALAFCARSTQRRGRPLPVAVNVAPRTLEQPGFAEQLLALLAAHDVPASALTLEILEQDAIDPQPHVLEQLLRLRMHGCKLSVDDFGTGASNLQRLLQMPFSELKIPGAFVRGMADEPRKSAAVAGALFMARRLALQVVAEGVESLDEFHSLMALGADLLQGYFIARPMGRDDLECWLQAHEATGPRHRNTRPSRARVPEGK